MQQYVMGVDGGATKTHVALYNLQTHELDLAEFGPSNHEGMAGGFEELRGVLTDMFASAFGKRGASSADVAAAALGMGGVDTPMQHAAISVILRDLGFGNFVLSNDAYLGVKAACPSGSGVSCVNGSGFSVVGLDPSGGMIQIGGIGGYTGDFGGGGYYVTQSVLAVYDQLFRFAPKTLLKDALFAILEENDRDLYMEKVSYHLAERRREFYLKVCMALHEAGNKGDEVALNIMATSAKQYARTIASVERNLNFPEGGVVEVALTGSQFTKGACRHAVDVIDQQLRVIAPAHRHELIVLDRHPVTGALNWALELAGRAGDPAAREVMQKELKILGD